MKKIIVMPKFKSEGAEADWWASPVGRTFLKHKSSEDRQSKAKAKGSSLVAQLSNKPSVQIAIRPPAREGLLREEG